MGYDKEEVKGIIFILIVIAIILVAIISGVAIEYNFELKKQQIISETEIRKAEIEKYGEYSENK